jgi:hypothetical protein
MIFKYQFHKTGNEDLTFCMYYNHACLILLSIYLCLIICSEKRPIYPSGTGSIVNDFKSVFNTSSSSLQEVAILIMLINLITLFCNLKIIYLTITSKCKRKFPKNILLKKHELVIHLYSDCIIQRLLLRVCINICIYFAFIRSIQAGYWTCQVLHSYNYKIGNKIID